MSRSRPSAAPAPNPAQSDHLMMMVIRHADGPSQTPEGPPEPSAAEPPASSVPGLDEATSMRPLDPSSPCCPSVSPSSSPAAYSYRQAAGVEVDDDIAAPEQEVNANHETRCREAFPTKASYDYAVSQLRDITRDARNQTNCDEKSMRTYRSPQLDYLGFARNVLK